jgi:F0F1-type ATP synthase membrane subunit a
MTQSLLAAADPLTHVLPHYLFEVGGIKVSNQMVMALVAAILMLLIFPRLFKHAATGPVEAPTGARNFFESILEFLRVEVIRPALKENTDRFIPFLWTLFFFILFCNLLGQLPINETIALITGGKVETHVGSTATGTIATTGALAILTFIIIHASGILQVFRALRDGTYGHHGHHEEHSADGSHGHEAAHDLEHVRGEALAADVPGDFKAIGNPTRHYEDDESFAKGHHQNGVRQGDGQVTLHGKGKDPATAAILAAPLYLWNFAPHPFKPAPGTPGAMAFFQTILDAGMWLFLLILELIGALIKPFALMVRLFANMTAGHIVLAALVGLIAAVPSVAGQIGVGIPVTALSLLIRILELFVAFLQAYIFTFLATLFIASAVAPEH